MSECYLKSNFVCPYNYFVVERIMLAFLLYITECPRSKLKIFNEQ